MLVENRLTTRVFDDIIKAWVGGKRRILLEGGTYSSKTFSALQSLLYIASVAERPLLISIVSESLPHLKQGAMKDFFVLLGETRENNRFFNMSESRYNRPDWKGLFEFFGADSEGKALGPRRDILFINEGNNIPWETARHLDTRTELFTIVDWNPTSEFWAHEYWKDEERNAYSHSTYQDALRVIPQEKVADIEAYKDKDPNWWRIFGLGLIGKIEGLVYPSFAQVDELPKGAYFYGLDFGFLIDPTVLTKHTVIGDNLYSQEMFYDRTGLTNDQIARKMRLLGVKHEPIRADPSQPQSIEELKREGFNIEEAEKGKGSVDFGVQRVNQYYQHWTKDSVNCIKEQRNFKYIKDRLTGELTDKTTHTWSHGMDSRRYAVSKHRAGSGTNSLISVGW